MELLSRHRLSALLRASSPWFLAIAAFVLAFVSPIDEARSDPAIALLAAQSLLDHGTLHLDAYLDDPACAYNLERDYRIRRQGGSFAYYSHGVSVLSVPAVWLANRTGYHMLDQGDEFALQNLLSALCCALLGVLFYHICRAYLEPAASLAVAAVSLFGSSLMSTLATGLWNVGYETLLLALGLLHLVRRQADATAPRFGYLAVLAGLAFLCRPTAGFAVLAAILTLNSTAAGAGTSERDAALGKRRVWIYLVLGLTLLAVLLAALDLAGWIPRYYSPLKLTPQAPLSTGLYGTLLSPSRGLLVFSPFLALVAAVCLRYLRPLAADRLFRLTAVWSGLHMLAIAIKGNWWGGHSYGPRLLAEVILPAVLLTGLAGRQLERRVGRRTRALVAAAYLACGLAAVYIHSYQGLFNESARRWNFTPDIDKNPRLAFDWRHPQFLATDDSLERRVLELERLELGTYNLGEEIPHDGGGALGVLFRDWYAPEPGWRWSCGKSPELLLNLGELPAEGIAPEGRKRNTAYLLHLRAASLGRQEVTLRVNGTEIGHLQLDGPVRDRAFAFERELLQPGRENSLRFELPGASSTANDSRVMALALHSFKLLPLADFSGIGVADDAFFVDGFSGAEGDWRWTDGHRAVIDYPVGDTAGLDTLMLTASVLDRQPVAIRLGGVEIGELIFEGGFDDVVTRSLTYDPGLVRPGMNRIELALPEARGTAEDARLLGLAFRGLELRRGPG